MTTWTLDCGCAWDSAKIEYNRHNGLRTRSCPLLHDVDREAAARRDRAMLADVDSRPAGRVPADVQAALDKLAAGRWAERDRDAGTAMEHAQRAVDNADDDDERAKAWRALLGRIARLDLGSHERSQGDRDSRFTGEDESPTALGVWTDDKEPLGIGDWETPAYAGAVEHDAAAHTMWSRWVERETERLVGLGEHSTHAHRERHRGRARAERHECLTCGAEIRCHAGMQTCDRCLDKRRAVAVLGSAVAGDKAWQGSVKTGPDDELERAADSWAKHLGVDLPDVDRWATHGWGSDDVMERRADEGGLHHPAVAESEDPYLKALSYVVEPDTQQAVAVLALPNGRDNRVARALTRHHNLRHVDAAARTAYCTAHGGTVEITKNGRKANGEPKWRCAERHRNADRHSKHKALVCSVSSFTA